MEVWYNILIVKTGECNSYIIHLQTHAKLILLHYGLGKKHFRNQFNDVTLFRPHLYWYALILECGLYSIYS